MSFVGSLTGSVLVQGDALTAYVATDGNNATAVVNDPALPFATLAAALTAIGNNGTIFVDGGTYIGEPLDLSATRNLSIIGVGLERSVFEFGELVSSFALYDNTQAVPIYVAAITTVATNQWTRVYENGTNYGAITRNYPVQRGKAYRMPDTPLTKASNILNVGASAGRWYYDSGNLYISTTDGAVPGSRVYSVSKQSATQSLLTNAVVGKATSLHIANIEVRNAFYGFKLDGFATVSIDRSRVFASTDTGIFAETTGYITLSATEFAGCGNDAIYGGPSTAIPTASFRNLEMEIRNCWVHDGLDKGIVAHPRATFYIYGGLVEHYASGGLMAFDGGEIYANGLTTANNAGAGMSAYGSASGSEGGAGSFIHAINCVSHTDFIPYRTFHATAKIIVENCISYSSTLHTLYADPGTIEASTLTVHGDNPIANSGGTITAKNVTLLVTATPTGAAPNGTNAINTAGSTGTTFYRREGGAWVAHT